MPTPRVRGHFRAGSIPIWGWAVVAVVLIAGGLGLLQFLGRAPTEVVVETAQIELASRVLAVNGQIAAKDSVQLRSAVVGTVIDLLADEGQQVAVDEVLARLDASQQEAIVRQADSALEQGLVRQAQVGATYSRIRELGENVARSKLEDAGRDLQTAAQEVDRLRALLDQATIQLDRYTIRAPIAGTVISRSVDLGQLVDTSAPMFTLADLSNLVVQTDVDEAYATEIAVGQTAGLQLVGNSATLPGTVTFVSPKVDPSTGGLAVKIAFDTPIQAPIGLTVIANIVIETREDALTVPRSAIVDDAVFIMKDGRATRAPVKFVDWPSERLIVTSGVQEGDAVIRDGSGLVEGQAVRAVGK